jgi:NAD(P)H-dependent FMN reductase
MTLIHIPVVIGTARRKRKSDQVALAVADLIAGRGDCTTEVVDVRDHVKEAVTVPNWGVGGANENSTAWKGIVEKSQALILIVPEYNHGDPGELKILLDSLWEEYTGMPVAVVGVSAGTLGGARVIDHLKPVLLELRLHPIREGVTFSRVGEAFTEDRQFTNEKTGEYINTMVTELVQMAKILAPLRTRE